ncbi:hypothetical protein ACFPLB_15360 [Aquamicrobium segne]|uniref:Type I secretion protein n=1 Tax=Aquamicrobium segne TaxID=469547 RepID=A0ABW0H085_9HYPH
MTTMDRITEEIAHFIGLFGVPSEDARIRDIYEDFTPDQSTPTIPDEANVAAGTPAAPYELLGFEPWVNYYSPGPQIVKLFPRISVKLEKIGVPEDGPDQIAYSGFLWPRHLAGSSQSQLPQIEPPGSVVNHLNQLIHLSDNDYFGVGDHGLRFSPEAVDNASLLDFADEALALSPIGELERPGSTEAIKDLIPTTLASLETFSLDASGPAQVFLHKAVTIDGIYVNGELVEEAPDIADYYSFEDEEDEAADGEPDYNAQLTPDGHFIVDVSVELDAGGNTLVNNVVMKNFWTAATVTAVVGDHIELNAIIQINALCDSDSITSAIAGWTQDDAVNQFLNIATFERIDAMEDHEPAGTGAVSFPKHWVVTEISGDLLIVNWLEQFTFQSDNDIGIVSSSGVTTKIIAGDNLGVNQVSIYELAFTYDLIIIGGSWYDANIIQQMNVLFDNDLIGAVSAFETTGEGSVSTSGNLLWNQAHIVNIGGADNYDALPSHYLEAANNLAAGNETIPGGVLDDAMFAGLGALRVLYIEGDLLNLQYIKQTNILGDSDQIALAMDAFGPHPEAAWTLSTGANALLNNAGIVDLDSLGKTYVGGEQYSQELLIQAELVSSKPDLWGQDPDALVSEAVAFLDDAMIADSSHEAAPGVYIADDLDAPSSDGLHTMLG